MFDWWWTFLYNISKWINECVDGIYKLFLFFAGAAPANVNDAIAGGENPDILGRIFNSEMVSIVFISFLGLAGGLFLVSILIGLLRSEVRAKDNKEGKVKVIKQACVGVGLLIFIPTLFVLGLMAISTLLTGIIGNMNGEGGIAQKLFEICLPKGGTLGNLGFDAQFTELQKAGYNMNDYNYFVAYIGGAVILFVFAVAALSLVERIISIVMLFLISPFVVAVSPLDDGNRLGIWKDLVISKLLGAAGMVMCFYVYFLCLPIVGNIFSNGSFLANLGYLIFAIGGAIAARKGGLLISNLVGHNTAMQEGQQMESTQRILMGGIRAGAHLIRGATHTVGNIARLLLGGGGESGGNGGSGGGGGAAPPKDGILQQQGGVSGGAAAFISNALQQGFQAFAQGFNSAGQGIDTSNAIDGQVVRGGGMHGNTGGVGNGSANRGSIALLGSGQGFGASSNDGGQSGGATIHLGGSRGDAVPNNNTVIGENGQSALPKKEEMVPASRSVQGELNKGAGFGSKDEGGGEKK